MPLSTTMIGAAVRLRLGIGLAEFYDAHPAAMPLLFIEQLARLAVARAAVEIDCPAQLHTNPEMGDLRA
jgi:hypothetical protein